MSFSSAGNLAGALCLAVLCSSQVGECQVFSPPTHEPWGKSSENNIWAQQVVNDLMRRNPDLAAIGLHAVPPGIEAEPGDPRQIIIAQVDDLIGRPDGASDLEIPKKNMVRIYNAPLGGVMRARVLAPLRDAAGRTIGLAVFSFKLDKQTTALSVHERAATLLDEMARQFPDRTSLFRPR